MKKNIINFVIGIGVIVMGFFSIIGCGQKEELEEVIIHAKEKARNKEYKNIKNSEIIVQKLKERYGKEYEVLSIEEVEGMTAVDDSFYLAEVNEKNNQTEFRVYWYYKNEIFQDTYAKVLFEKEFKRIENAVLEKNTDFQILKCKFFYQESDKVWKENELEQYLSESGTYIDIECEIGNRELEEVSESLFQLVQILNNVGVKYFLRCSWREQKIFLNDSMNIFQEEDILKIMEK